MYVNFVNGNEVEVIELHENKSLDQMVLEQIETENVEDTIDNNNTGEENNELIVLEEQSTINETMIQEDNFWDAINLEDVKNFLNNSKNINSRILQNEFSNFLESSNFDLSIKRNREIYYLITNYFYKTGNISKAYYLVNQRNFENDENLEFYNMININYLLSTFQLEEVCNLKENYSSNKVLENFLINKLDIFCLVLVENYTEAELLNSILIETESNLDKNFQDLYTLVTIKDNEINDVKINFDSSTNKDLIFLYSAMLRIADLPLNENFLNVDPKNLAIPIILNQSSPIELRIQAANQSYKNNGISIESLAALYQSVDFNSNQLNNPENTIKNLSNNIQMLMAYYYQLINIQIFPSDRLNALISFWNFAKLNDLEEIAYALSNQTINSVKISAENLKFSPNIATCLIYNKNFANALEWIEFYELSNGIDEKSTYTRILLDLYSTKEINSIVEVILNNSETLISNDDVKNEELIFILLDILEKNNENIISNNYDKIYDERLMPSLFITQKLNESILNKNYNNFLIFSIISINNRQWHEIHPEHLKLVLSGYLIYKNGDLMRELVLEIFKNYKIL